MLIKSSRDLATKLSVKVPLSSIIVVPFLIQILGTVGLTGWLSFRNGQRAVNDLASQLSQEITHRIEKHVQTYLNNSHILHEVSIAAIDTGILDLNNFDALQHYFWHQVKKAEPGTTYFYGNEEGEFVGVRREEALLPEDAQTVLMYRDKVTAPNWILYNLDSQGDRTGIRLQSEYDPRSRPWYETAERLGKPSWSPIYRAASRPALLITAVLPIYEQTGELLGVLGSDVALSQISDFLNTLEISPNGEAFIIERSAEIVASSSIELPFIITDSGPRRLNVTEISEPLVQATASHLIEKFGSFDGVGYNQQFTFELNGDRQLVQVAPIQDQYGLDLLIVVAIPESDFMERIDANTRSTIWLCLASLGVATLLGLMTAKWIVEPILRLNMAAKKLAGGEWEQSLPATRSYELGELAKSFNRMTDQLKESFDNLARINLAYGHFVPHKFLDFLDRDTIVDVKLGDQVLKEMTVMFSDIRSFTTLSEGMTPQENFNFLNSFLGRIGPIIRKHNGFIDKYIGDGIMALFPEEPDKAVQAAIAMQKKVLLYNKRRQSRGKQAISIGIGINTGMLMLGTIGEEQRMESTVISDTVNLGSRLEGLTKLYGAGIVMSEQTLEQLRSPDRYGHRFLARVRVKGKSVPVSIFEVFDGDSPSIRKVKQQTCAKFEEAINFYFEQKFALAASLFQEVLEKNEKDKAARLYWQRCESLQTVELSPDWDGVENLDSK